MIQSTGNLWSKVNALSGKCATAPSTTCLNGTYTNKPNVITNGLVKHFTKLPSFNKYDQTGGTGASAVDVVNSNTTPVSNQLDINQPFSLGGLQHDLSRSNGKSAGADVVGYPLITSLLHRAKLTLLDAIELRRTHTETGPPSSDRLP